MGAKFLQKILNSIVVAARQSFQFFKQNTWFLKSNGALPKFLYGILHYLAFEIYFSFYKCDEIKDLRICLYTITRKKNNTKQLGKTRKAYRNVKHEGL